MSLDLGPHSTEHSRPLPYTWDLHTATSIGASEALPNLAGRRHSTARRCGGGLVRSGYGV
eukprot:365337-Chlamydomonas_euryale.AAC.5